MDIHIRWLIRRDLETVLAIEKAGFDSPWLEEDFIRHLRSRNCIGMVAESGCDVVGFMVYLLHKHHIDLLNLAVHPEHRHMGVGTALMAKLQTKLSYERRSRIVLHVAERNMDAQLFFKAMGFHATVVVNYTDEDAYEMECHYEPTIQEVIDHLIIGT